MTFTSTITADFLLVILVRNDVTTPIQIGDLKVCVEGRPFFYSYVINITLVTM